MTEVEHFANWNQTTMQARGNPNMAYKQKLPLRLIEVVRMTSEYPTHKMAAEFVVAMITALTLDCGIALCVASCA